MNWQPIETAPKDGRNLILLLTPSGFPQVAYSNTWWTAGFSVECKPTHWMPLPEPPRRLTMTEKLDGGQKNILRLIKKGQQCPDGWCPVSAVVYPLVQKTMPVELVEHHMGEDGRGRARLTAAGENLFDAMDWL